jgi:TrmH family RNA methyltransferase
MPDSAPPIASLQNSRVKQVVKLRQRSHRDELGLLLIEGYREIGMALRNRHFPRELFCCPELFLGANEPALIEQCAAAGAQVHGCTPEVFQKMSYRDRPDGLIAVAPQVRYALTALAPRQPSLFVVAEAIEKPGNLGTILRSADAAGADAAIVCDRCTDINNPNVVRASVGALFALPVVETSSAEAMAWLKERQVRIVAASPHAAGLYSDADLSGDVAFVVGTEQYGLSEPWMTGADLKVRIPMRGQADSLNVAAATTILLFEAVRQRSARC